jgi:hypothetical protein
VGESGILGNLSDVTSLTRHGGCAWWTYLPPPPPTHGTNIERNEGKLEPMVCSLTEDYTKDSKGGSSQGKSSSIKIPNMKARKGSRLKMVGLNALPSRKRVVVWCLDPVEDTEHYFQQLHRLNQGLNTGHWRVYERREEPNGTHYVLSIDLPSVAAVGKMGW